MDFLSPFPPGLAVQIRLFINDPILKEEAYYSSCRPKAPNLVLKNAPCRHLAKERG